MISVRKASDRGHANHGWLNTYHTFSFADYFDPKYMGFSSLRVINDDTVQPGEGFPKHPHRDMEILSYILEGAIEHKDSMGTKSRVEAGEFQIMSAGTGVYHSEYNPNQDKLLHFLQIWIQPNQVGLTPRYEQKSFTASKGLHLVLSPDARDGSLKVFQDMCLWRWALQAGDEETFKVKADRRVWLHVVKGNIQVMGAELKTADGAAISGVDSIPVKAIEASEVLVFDLA